LSFGCNSIMRRGGVHDGGSTQVKNPRLLYSAMATLETRRWGAAGSPKPGDLPVHEAGPLVLRQFQGAHGHQVDQLEHRFIAPWHPPFLSPSEYIPGSCVGGHHGENYSIQLHERAGRGSACFQLRHRAFHDRHHCWGWHHLSSPSPCGRGQRFVDFVDERT